ncbi:MAG: hypothetical protein J0H80_17300 [Rhizobiales bacterium]|nr:hypothetical protein [Hyphomicrobiales bacterium]
MNAVDRKNGPERRIVVSRLRCLADHLKANVPLDPDDRDFILNGLEAFLSASSVASLDHALGLRSRGGASVRTVLRNEERDYFLRHLAREHHAWSFLPPSLAARQMRRAFDVYEAGRWCRDRSADIAPVTEPHATFWRLLKADMRMPQQKRLSQILDMEIQYPV